MAILPVLYTLYNTGETSPEKSDKVQEAAGHAARDSGAEIIQASKLDEALDAVTQSRPDTCRDQECIRKLADHLSATNVIFISVVDKEGMYEVTVVPAHGDATTVKPFGTFTSLTDRIFGIVKELLDSQVEEEPIVVKEEDPEEKDEEPVKEYEYEKLEPEKEQEGLAPTAFYISAGVTGALALTWGIIDLVVYSRYKKLDAGTKKSNDYWETTKSLKGADWAFMGMTAAGLVTTGVLFFLTNFDKKKQETTQDDPDITLAPAVLENGGMMTIGGRF
ncbi:MAG: hypothetical protein GY854_26200 [Deltaproteobacteria bacterium]|nr:hypothetical protein [Deltaproteobacteria bacterium]